MNEDKLLPACQLFCSEYFLPTVLDRAVELKISTSDIMLAQLVLQGMRLLGDTREVFFCCSKKGKTRGVLNRLKIPSVFIGVGDQ